MQSSNRQAQVGELQQWQSCRQLVLCCWRRCAPLCAAALPLTTTMPGTPARGAGCCAGCELPPLWPLQTEKSFPLPGLLPLLLRLAPSMRHMLLPEGLLARLSRCMVSGLQGNSSSCSSPSSEEQEPGALLLWPDALCRKRSRPEPPGVVGVGGPAWEMPDDGGTMKVVLESEA